MLATFETKPLISWNFIFLSETATAPESECPKPASACGFFSGKVLTGLVVRGSAMCCLWDWTGLWRRHCPCVCKDLHLTVETQLNISLHFLSFPPLFYRYKSQNNRKKEILQALQPPAFGGSWTPATAQMSRLEQREKHLPAGTSLGGGAYFHS